MWADFRDTFPFFQHLYGNIAFFNCSPFGHPQINLNQNYVSIELYDQEGNNYMYEIAEQADAGPELNGYFTWNISEEIDEGYYYISIN